MLWSLQDDLAGALVVNMRGFHSDDFTCTDLYPKVTKRFKALEECFAHRSVEKLQSFMEDYAASGDANAVELFAAALAGAPAVYFEHGAFHCRNIWLDIMERTRTYKERGPLRADLPVVLACGAFSPAMWTLEAVQRLRHLVPQASIEYIPACKSCWELEGEDQHAAVTALLVELLCEVPTLEMPRVARVVPTRDGLPEPRHACPWPISFQACRGCPGQDQGFEVV